MEEVNVGKRTFLFHFLFFLSVKQKNYSLLFFFSSSIKQKQLFLFYELFAVKDV